MQKVPRSLYAVDPTIVVDFATKHARTPFSGLTHEERYLLAEIAACRFCCELYLYSRASALGKTVVIVHNGEPLNEVPEE